MKFRTEYNSKSSNHSITHNDSCMLLGSCFSQNIGQKLVDHGLSSIINPTGILYNPGSINKMVHLLLAKGELDSSRFIHRQDQTFHYDFHSDFHAKSEDSFALELQQIQSQFQDQWSKTKTLIITLGTSWVYNFKENFVANCHKQDSSNFDKRLMSTSEIKSQIEDLYTLTKEMGIHLIFTVSPVRHVKDGIIENQRSKAQLISAIHEVIDVNPDIEYFPSYEIVMDDLRDYRFFENDLVHPNNQAIEYIWEKFVETYFSHDTKDICKQFFNIRKMQEHRPLFPDSQENSKFQEQLLEKVNAFRKAYPNVAL